MDSLQPFFNFRKLTIYYTKRDSQRELSKGTPSERETVVRFDIKPLKVPAEGQTQKGCMFLNFTFYLRVQE